MKLLKLLMNTVLLLSVFYNPLKASWYFGENFNAPIGGAASPWYTNVAYGRDGVISSKGASQMIADSIVSGKLTIRGWTCDDEAYNGYWAGRWIRATNLFYPSAQSPFGFEVIREMSLLDYDSGYSTDKYDQVALGIALYADPYNSVTTITNNSLAGNFQNGASWFDFVDFEGYSASAEQTLGYYNGASRNLRTNIAVAMRPDGTRTNVSNVFLISYRSPGLSTNLLTETFSNLTDPPGWTTGSNVTYLPGNSFGGLGTNCMSMPSNAYFVIGPFSRPSHIRIAFTSSNLGAKYPQLNIYASTNSANGPWFIPHPTSGASTYWPCAPGANGISSWFDASAAANFMNEFLHSTNVWIRVVSTLTNANVDNVRIYQAPNPNTNSVGFRMVHDGTYVSMYVNPNPYNNPSVSHPNEWLLLNQEQVLFTNAVQLMVGHMQRCASRPNYYDDNRYAHGTFDNVLVRSATTGSSWWVRPTDGPTFSILITNGIFKGKTAGVNTLRLTGGKYLGETFASLIDPRVTVGGVPKKLVKWNPLLFPQNDEVAVIWSEADVKLIFGKQITETSEARIQIDNLPIGAKPTAVFVNAEQYSSMSRSQQGHYSTCGWEKSTEVPEPLLVKK